MTEDNLENLPGVGPTIADKLREAGYMDLMAIAVESPSKLSDLTEIGESTAAKIIAAAKLAADVGKFETGDIVLERRKTIGKLTSGSKALDDLMGGGFETQAISEFFGEFGSGKCFAGDTLVYYTNSSVTHLEPISEIYQTYRQLDGEVLCDSGSFVPTERLEVIAYDQRTGAMVRTRAAGIYRERVEKIVEIRSAGGRLLRLSAPHRLLAKMNGTIMWVPAGLLSAGEEFAVPSALPVGPDSDEHVDRGFSLGESLGASEGFTLPPEMLSASADTVLSFLAGFFRGQGAHDIPEQTRVGNERLASQLIYLLSQVGIAASSSSRSADSPVTIDFHGGAERLQGMLEGARRSQPVGPVQWDEIISVRTIQHDDHVYDLVVPQLHNLVGGNLPTVLHNTQICHQLAVNVTMPRDKGGIEGHSIIIDTEQTFRPERIIQMSDALDLDTKEILRSIHVARAFNSHHQMLLIEKAYELAREFPIRLIVVDSLTAHFRAEYIGRGALAERQQALNKHMHDLMRFGDLNNAVIAVTNQVAAKPDAFFGDPTRPIGGHIVGHTATFRLYLRKSKGGKRIARLIDSPNLPEAEAVFTVSEDGISD